MLNVSRADIKFRWSLPTFVIATYSLFLAGFYFVPNAVDLYKFYIGAVFLPGLFLLPAVLRRSRGSRIWHSLLIYLGYMLLSSLWSDNFSLAILWRDVCYTAYILSFILLTLYFFERNRLLPDAIMQGVALAAIAAAAISVITFKGTAQLPALPASRLVGLGITDNPNPSAFIYGFFGVIALDYVRQHWGEKLAGAYATGVIVIVIFVILTQSNTSLLALTTACAVLFLADCRSDKLTYPTVFAGLVLGGATATYLAWSLGLMNSDTDIGFMNRLPIWEHVLEQWKSAPIFGHGFQKVTLLTDDGKPSIANYAHSLFLSTLRDGGLFGLALLLLTYFFTLRSAVKMAFTEHRALYLSLLAFSLTCVLVDTDQIVTRPRELWIILWLPLACLIAYELGLSGGSPANSPAPQAGGPLKNIC